MVVWEWKTNFFYFTFCNLPGFYRPIILGIRTKTKWFYKNSIKPYNVPNKKTSRYIILSIYKMK